MNRNTMYEYLKSMGMYQMAVWRESRRKYHMKFVLNNDKKQTYCEIVTDWGYIRDVDTIRLCRDEIVVEAKWSDMKVNIKYKAMKKFEVYIESELDE